MRIDEWLSSAADQLKDAGVRSYRLDAELLLGDVLGKNRPHLHAHNGEVLTTPQMQRAQDYLKRRLQRMPLAYIVGHKEFYGRSFAVTPHVLIPRPETEAAIEVVESLNLPASVSIADIGTGSGAIAITLKLNQPKRRVFATDISAGALAIARQNVERLNADIILLQGDLAQPLRGSVDIIIANLPYVDPEWERSPETDFEPSLALFAENHGLALIEQLIGQTPERLAQSGYLLLEADPEQHAKIISFAHENNLQHIRTEGYCLIFRKIA